ncbi:cysteine-rich receptor-like protein kinase 44 [Mercurialis annua]|uniref:cysteine-rich receptor-like protein kinase 44 n=1 Tax=Mercurialis annua TaxID=3986 RepID=UPI002160FBA4|nr:cysteine-rich receptor-like protein kinase 44 [Mercurialis annua]
MAPSKMILFLLSILIGTVIFSEAQPNFFSRSCSETGNYTNNSVYKSNLNTLLTSIASDTNINYGFYNFSFGQDPDRVYAISLCRGDVELDSCRSCVKDSTRRILQDCPNQKEAVGWYDNCMIRFSNMSIFGIMEDQPKLHLFNVNNVTSVDLFNQALRTLLDSLKAEAASGSSIRKFATGDAVGPDFLTIYALSQCTPDLSDVECNDCLEQSARYIPDCCNGKVGARVVTPSCNLRYETSRFYNTSAPPPPKEEDSNTSRTVVIIVVPIVGVLILLICLYIFLKRRKPRQRKPDIEDVDEIINAESLQFDFATIRAATDNFSDANKLGQGGFGSVYKGRLSDGQEVAVKRLATGSGQGDLEFKNEVLLVAKLQHRNLVRLLGFCLSGNERLLVYEFVPNTSLDHFLFDSDKRAYLDWDKRYKIIGGIARGLVYLHEDSRLRIIHRDLKASNILLDAEMNSKIADFGMARLFIMDQTQGNTSRIVGTYGYMAPEYAMHGYFSVKSDVYSFGVLLLEIVSGQKNNSFRSGDNVEDLLSYAWRNWKEETCLNIVDTNLRNGSRNEMMRCIHIGLLCVQENVADRPTMASVVLMLSSNSLTLPVPLRPHSFMSSSSGSDNFNSQGYVSEVTE